MTEQRPNRKRPAGVTLPNMYLITIPRCDLPKKFIFKGLEPICNRLLVSKENHTISYIDSCCKNSSVRKKNLNEEKIKKDFLIKERSFNKNLRNEKHTNEKDFSKKNEISMNVSDTIDCLDFSRQSNSDLNNRNYLEDGISNKTKFDTKLSDCHSNQSTSKHVLWTIEHKQAKKKDEVEDDWIHCKSHLHIFAEFDEEHVVDFEKCNRIMNWCADGYKSNIEACKSARNAIIYCTKEDSDPLLKNINPDECAFYKKLIDWIKANPEFNYYDPFICSRPNLYKIIVLAHTDYYKKNPIKVSACFGLKTLDLETNGCTTKLQVLNWYNQCVSNWRLKFPALYLWGESNTGKTTMIFDWLLPKIVNELQIFRPARNCQFAWADFDPTNHRVIVMDEFEFSQYDNEEWKNLVEGRPTAIRVKGRPSKVISLKCPIIMISNYPPPFEKKEIINRLNIVKSQTYEENV